MVVVGTVAIVPLATTIICDAKPIPCPSGGIKANTNSPLYVPGDIMLTSKFTFLVSFGSRTYFVSLSTVKNSIPPCGVTVTFIVTLLGLKISMEPEAVPGASILRTILGGCIEADKA